MEAKKQQVRHLPRWLFDGKTPDALVTHRRCARTTEEKMAVSVAAKMGWKREKFDRDIGLIRKAADGRGHVDQEAERQACALFLETWDAFGPTRAERMEWMRSRNERVGTSPAEAASLVERMAQLRRRHITNGRAAV